MTDPAVEAAERALSRTTDGMNQASRRRVAETAAREALKPIREWYEDSDRGFSELPALIFTSEELAR